MGRVEIQALQANLVFVKPYVARLPIPHALLPPVICFL